LDERDAIRRCLDGDKDAFAHLVRQYQAQILGVCLRMLGSREDAADVAQQVFVRAYRNLGKYDQSQPFGPWLFRIATNECFGFLRLKKNQMTAAGTEVLEYTPDPDEGAPALLDRAEDQERVRRAVAQLPPQYRSVVVLYYFEELSYQEIARQTGLPVGTISTNLYRAKQLLRRQLAQEEVDPGEASAGRPAAKVSGR